MNPRIQGRVAPEKYDLYKKKKKRVYQKTGGNSDRRRVSSVVFRSLYRTTIEVEQKCSTFLFDKEVKNGKMGSMGSMDTPTPKIQKRCAMKELIRRIRYKVINILLDEEKPPKEGFKITTWVGQYGQHYVAVASKRPLAKEELERFYSAVSDLTGWKCTREVMVGTGAGS